ncbi:MAG: CPBP family glutamic-type intramembrane protease [Planctomycetota bacterium]
MSETFRLKASMICPLLAVFAAGIFFDTSPVEDGQAVNGPVYFALVMTRVIAVSAVVIFFGRAILAQFPFQVDHWSWIVGIVGVFLWIGVCELEPEKRALSMLGFSTQWLEVRDAVNPFTTYSGSALVAFIAARFTLLAICIPVAEELFLRGFIMRAVETESWHELSLTQIGRTGLVAATVYAVLTHPGEAGAAVLWFSMISVLMVKTGKFWNCVVAHAVTNLLLGIYVCYFGKWHLW